MVDGVAGAAGVADAQLEGVEHVGVIVAQLADEAARRAHVAPAEHVRRAEQHRRAQLPHQPPRRDLLQVREGVLVQVLQHVLPRPHQATQGLADVLVLLLVALARVQVGTQVEQLGPQVVDL